MCLSALFLRYFSVCKLGSVDTRLLQEAILGADWLYVARLAVDLEWQANCEKDWKEIGSLSDHWVNYQERFIKGGETQLPDEIWVGDAHAENMARGLFLV